MCDSGACMSWETSCGCKQRGGLLGCSVVIHAAQTRRSKSLQVSRSLYNEQPWSSKLEAVNLAS